MGRAAAVAQFGRFRIAGFVAWWLWWVVHIFYLIGYRNRLAVMIGWAWQYFAFWRGARLITGRAWSPTASRDVPSDPGADPAVSGAPPGTADAG